MRAVDLARHVARLRQQDEEAAEMLLTAMLTRCWPTLLAQKQ